MPISMCLIPGVCMCAGLLLRVGRGIETPDSVALALHLRPSPVTPKGEAIVFGRKRAPRAPACGLWLQQVLYDASIVGMADTKGRGKGRQKTANARRKRRSSQAKGSKVDSKGAERKKRRALVSACLQAVQPRTANDKATRPQLTNDSSAASKPPPMDAGQRARQRAEQARVRAAKSRKMRMQLQSQRDDARRAAIKALLRKTCE